jgi:hypothetical protein
MHTSAGTVPKVVARMRSTANSATRIMNGSYMFLTMTGSTVLSCPHLSLDELGRCEDCTVWCPDWNPPALPPLKRGGWHKAFDLSSAKTKSGCPILSRSLRKGGRNNIRTSFFPDLIRFDVPTVAKNATTGQTTGCLIKCLVGYLPFPYGNCAYKCWRPDSRRTAKITTIHEHGYNH